MQPEHEDADESTTDGVEQPSNTKDHVPGSYSLCQPTVEPSQHLRSLDAFLLGPDGDLTVFETKTSRAQWADTAQRAVSTDAAQNLTQAATGAMLDFVQRVGRGRRTGSFSRSIRITFTPPPDIDLMVHLDPGAVELLTPYPQVRRDLKLKIKSWSRSEASVELERATATVAFADLLTRWQELKTFGPVDPERFLCTEHSYDLDSWDAAVVETTQLLAVGVAHHATREAMAVRESIVRDPPSISRAKIAEFTKTWLGRKPHPEVLDVVGDALLYAQLNDLPDDDQLVRRLKRDAIHQYRLQRPLTDTQLCHRRITSLDQPLPGVEGATVQTTMADTIPSRDLVDNLVEARLDAWDERIQQVLGRLKPAELDVARAYAGDDTLTWHGAAESCGREPTVGTRVQRKLRRLGEQFLARAAARPRTA